eukprot:5935402-Pyramimonas_sp.AAC.1
MIVALQHRSRMLSCVVVAPSSYTLFEVSGTLGCVTVKLVGIHSGLGVFLRVAVRECFIGSQMRDWPSTEVAAAAAGSPRH